MAKAANQEKVLAASLSIDSIAAVAKKSKVSEPTIYRLLNDETSPAQLEIQKNLKRQLDVLRSQPITGTALEQAEKKSRKTSLR